MLAGVRSAPKAAPLASVDVEHVVVDFDRSETLSEAVKVSGLSFFCIAYPFLSLPLSFLLIFIRESMCLF